jgi:PhnB protein
VKSTTRPSIAPWLSVRDATRAIEVAQLSIGGAVFWVQNDVAASPDGRVAGSVPMILSVGDPDSVFEPAVAAGVTITAAIHEQYGWRTGRVRDPFGHDWDMSQQLAPA